jgi:hypothetical protein
MDQPLRIYRVRDFATEFVSLAEMRPIIAEARALLAQPLPDTFLGRRRLLPIALPHEEW